MRQDIGGVQGRLALAGARLARCGKSFLCLALCIGVIYALPPALRTARARWPLPDRHAYTAYLIHEPVITLLAVAAADIALYPLLKFGLAALILVPLCFALSVLVRKIPGADRVL